MRWELTNCNDRMHWDATAGTQTRRFPFTGKAYGPESDTARTAAMAWIETMIGAP